jgi:thiol-disulfide isomerase/thioredoxin
VRLTLSDIFSFFKTAKMKTLAFLVIFLIPGFSLSAQKDLHVYVFIAEECPICNYMGKPLSDLAKKYEGTVSFHAVFPTKNSNYKTAQLFKEQYALMSYETLLDKDQAWTRKLGATITPEAVITDNAGEILYRGRINNAYYAPGKMKHSSIRPELEDALETLASGKNITQPWPPAIGCYITTYASR